MKLTHKQMIILDIKSKIKKMLSEADLEEKQNFYRRAMLSI